MAANRNKFLNILKKLWNFLWNGDSFLSWISFIVVIFIIIKFIFFPLMSLLTGTSLPIVIVESCSMYHNADFDLWWGNYGEWYAKSNIEKENFSAFQLKNGFSKGDIIFITGIKKEEMNLGDIIVFSSGQLNNPIIHRVVSLPSLDTKGDNNNINGNEQLSFEKNIDESRIIGKASFLKIPFIGWVKLIFYEPFRPESERGFCK